MLVFRPRKSGLLVQYLLKYPPLFINQLYVGLLLPRLTHIPVLQHNITMLNVLYYLQIPSGHQSTEVCSYVTNAAVFTEAWADTFLK